MKMPEEVKQSLRGRPANASPLHEYGSASQRNMKLAQLDGLKKSGGLNCLKRLFSGQVLRPRDAIKAMCCECLGYYADGLSDCEAQLCPLYHYMPYRKKLK